jgi:hypothetical protein
MPSQRARQGHCGGSVGSFTTRSASRSIHAPRELTSRYPRRVGHGAAVSVDRDALLLGDQRPLPTVAAVTAPSGGGPLGYVQPHE